MIFISLLILIVAMALFSEHNMRYNRISALILFYAGALTLNALYIQSIGSGIGIYGGLFQITIISQFFDLFIFLIGAIILLVWPLIINTDSLKLIKENKNNDNYITNNYKSANNYITEYSLIVLFTTIGASLLISSADLVAMYLSIELQSFGVYILTSLYRDSESATSAGLKYFLLGGLSSCIILLGSGLIYSYTGLTNFESIYSLISVSNNDSNILQSLILGFLLIIIGFLFKIAAAPLHNWSPDVYDDSPTIVTIWLTIMPKISIIILLLEINTQINLELILGNNTINVIKYLLLISSLLSLLLGTIVGLAQIKIKRLLAYSTISHVGFILLALAISTEQSIESLIFYIIQYTITNLNSFLIIIALSYIIYNSLLIRTKEINKFNNENKINTLRKRELSELKDINFISEFKSQFLSNPLLSLSLSICLFSMAGIPPLIGFFSKQFVLLSAIQSGYYFMAIIAILVSVISASYYLKIIKVLHTEREIDTTDSLIVNDTENNLNSNISDSKNLNIKSESLLTNVHSFFISILTLIILLFVLKPSIILSSIRILSLSIFYY
jgi:NADH-ubiquinone oxidoreductase chain 2